MSQNATDTAKMPPGISYIIGNEAAERFSFYGMRAILVVFMTKYLMDMSGNLDVMTGAQATQWFHTFVSAVYFFPILGALIADIFWGKYKTIMILSVVYCLGHLALALFETREGLAVGLILIAVGSGGIKPCVSAHVGDQFTSANQSLLEKVFGYFYFAINFGSTISTLATPWLLQAYGPSWAFGVPGILMFVATVLFYMGRDKFTAVEAVGWKRYKEEVLSHQGIKALLGLGVLYIFIAFFWSLFDQTASAWVLQADKMNLNVNLGLGAWSEFKLLPSQLQAINPIMVMGFIPLFSLYIYPMCGKLTKITPLRKIGAGFFVTGVSFLVTAYVEHLIASGQTPSILWHVLAYAVITSAEILISITALEFSYTQAPNAMKSLIMGTYLLSVTLGNVITAIVSYMIQDSSGNMMISGVNYYLLFVSMVWAAGVLFVFVAKNYKEERYMQS